jgi:DNA end-binding protein Ku
VSFNRINRKTGNRLKQQNVDSETGEEVPREDIARGYDSRYRHYHASARPAHYANWARR